MGHAIPKPWAPREGEPPAASSRLPDEGVTATQHVAWLRSRDQWQGGDPYRFVLLLRFGLLNLFGFGLLGAAFAQGMVSQVLTADRTNLSLVIFLVFLVGLALCATRIWRTSRELNSVRLYDADPESPAAQYVAPLIDRNPESRTNLVGALRLKIAHRTTIVRHVANSLVLLGLIGTVLGFIIALSGVDPEIASDVRAITPMVSTLIQGMSTALYTTLVGAVLNVWLMINHQVLASGTVKLITAIVELAESHARD